MKRVLALLVSLVAILALAGCDSPPAAGTVYNKQYSASYTWIQYVNGGCNVWTKSGNTQICVSYQQIPIVQTEPDHWRLCLKAADGKKGCREVDELEYSQYNVGDQYPRRS
jgi:hypothetical protein